MGATVGNGTSEPSGHVPAPCVPPAVVFLGHAGRPRVSFPVAGGFPLQTEGRAQPDGFGTIKANDIEAARGHVPGKVASAQARQQKLRCTDKPQLLLALNGIGSAPELAVSTMPDLDKNQGATGFERNQVDFARLAFQVAPKDRHAVSLQQLCRGLLPVQPLFLRRR